MENENNMSVVDFIGELENSGMDSSTINSLFGGFSLFSLNPDEGGYGADAGKSSEHNIDGGGDDTDF